MYTLLFCATVIALASAATVTTTGANPNVKAFPEKGLRTQNFATIRFLNQLSTVSNGVFQADDDDFTSLSQIEAFVVVSGETDQEVNFSGGGDGITNYETITLAEDPVSSFTIVLRNTPADAMDTAATLATCPSITVDGLRKTIVLTQTETPVNEFDTCTTTSGSSACTRQVGTEVSFQCQVFSESLTPARTCDTLPADFIQFHESTCPLRSAQTSNTNAINAAIAASSNNVIAVLGNNIEDVEELVEDVEELVEDVEDEAGDAVDAAEDADKAAKKATSQAKAAKNLVKEVLAILPTPPPVFVP